MMCKTAFSSYTNLFHTRGNISFFCNINYIQTTRLRQYISHEDNTKLAKTTCNKNLVNHYTHVKVILYNYSFVIGFIQSNGVSAGMLLVWNMFVTTFEGWLKYASTEICLTP